MNPHRLELPTVSPLIGTATFSPFPLQSTIATTTTTTTTTAKKEDNLYGRRRSYCFILPDPTEDGFELVAISLRFSCCIVALWSNNFLGLIDRICALPMLCFRIAEISADEISVLYPRVRNIEASVVKNNWVCTNLCERNQCWHAENILCSLRAGRNYIYMCSMQKFSSFGKSKIKASSKSPT